LKDYYEVIKKPVSLKSVQKLATGVHGRGAPTGITDFKSWDEFEEEVSYIWRNAQAYNEDVSEMNNLAIEFEDIFKARLAEAKAAIDEPRGPTLKLKTHDPIKIRLNTGHANSDARQPSSATPDPRSTPAGDQRPQTATSANGQAAQRQMSEQGTKNPFGASRSGSAAAVPVLAPHGSERAASSASASSPPAATMTNGVKSESTAPLSMPPPSVTAARTHSGSPHPQAAAQTQLSWPPQHGHPGFAHQQMTPANGFDRYRPAGKGTISHTQMPPLSMLTSPPPQAPKTPSCPL
jgi:hypothetical protein